MAKLLPYVAMRVEAGSMGLGHAARAAHAAHASHLTQLVASSSRERGISGDPTT